MGPNLLLALQALSLLLGTVAEAATAIERIRTVLNKARTEGRDVADAEVADLRAETDALQKSVLEKLRAVEGGTNRP